MHSYNSAVVHLQVLLLFTVFFLKFDLLLAENNENLISAQPRTSARLE